MATYKELMIARETFWQMALMLGQFALKNGIHIMPSYLFRDKETQARLVADKASKTMASLHRKACAIDFVMADNIGDYAEVTDSADPRWHILGKYWTELGGKWGGDWGWDAGHFEFWPYND